MDWTMEKSTSASVVHLITSSIFLVFLSTVFQTQSSHGHMIGRNPHHRSETLDPLGKYQLEWLVDWSRKRITFNVSVETWGYVGFGLSRNGKMTGADIVIGGVEKNGKPYFSDRHAVGNHLPELDRSQDWTLNSAWQTPTHTCLSFSRDFDTCDPEDYLITNNKLSIIWAYGERDSNMLYHYENRGAFNVYLLDPDYSPELQRDPVTQLSTIVDDKLRSETNVWRIARRLQIPENDTSYLCTMHKSPPLEKKHHVIGFEMAFANEESRRHVHHVILYRCSAPPGIPAAALFEASLGLQNIQQCYISIARSGPMRTEFCTEIYQGWAVGMRPYFSPPQVGFPLGEQSPDEYYMLQVHYDNPERRADIVVDMTVEMYYTDKLRPNDGSFLAVGHDPPGMPGSLLIPPSTPRHTIFGHCSAECSRRMLPEEGLTVYGALLHSHNAGRELRLHHFRGRKELPWLQSDDNYAFNYQDVRMLREEVKIMRGDHLTMSCVYDSTSSTNGTIVGGFSTRQEMCLSFLLYYTRLNGYTFCTSTIDSEKNRQRFLGISNVTWDESQLEFVVDTPTTLAGLSVSQVSDNLVRWDLDRRNDLQESHAFHQQQGRCPKDAHARRMDGDDDFIGPTGFPYDAISYRPEKRSCSFRGKYR